jgi:tetratricopeptide (TPR) repeat protein
LTSSSAPRNSEAIGAYSALLELDPPDPAKLHFNLGRLLREQDEPAAKRHIVQALEEAPRYREALKLLLAMQSSSTNATPKPVGLE